MKKQKFTEKQILELLDEYFPFEDDSEIIDIFFSITLAIVTCPIQNRISCSSKRQEPMNIHRNHVFEHYPPFFLIFCKNILNICF